MTDGIPRIALLAAFVLTYGCLETVAGDPMNADGLPVLTLEEEVRLGSADDPEEGFSGIGSTDGVDVDRDGNVYVMDRLSAEVRVFSPDGQRLRAFGREGEGPGEFQYAPQIGVFGDTVWALHVFPAPRLTLFTRQGEHLMTSPVLDDVMVPIGDGETTARVRMQYVGADGAFIGAYFGTSGERPTGAFRTPRVSLDTNGAVLDTIGFDIITPPAESPPSESITIGGREYRMPRVPMDEEPSRPMADGRLFVDGPAPAAPGLAEFTVVRLGLNGDTVAQRTFRYEARPYTDAFIDTLVWRRVNLPSGTMVIRNGIPQRPPPPDDPDAVFRALRDALSVPDFQPPITDVHAGKDGSVWLTWSDDGSTEETHIILRPDLEPVGQLVLPRSTYFGWLTTEAVWLVEPDEFDVPWLVKYRVHGG